MRSTLKEIYTYNKYIRPNGALTSKSYTFGLRPWELKNYEIFDPTSEFYQPILAVVGHNGIRKILPINSRLVESYNWISNRTRFFFENTFFLSKILDNLALHGVLSIRRLSSQSGYFGKFRVIPRTWFLAINLLTNKFRNLEFCVQGVINTSQIMSLDSFSILDFQRLSLMFPNLFKIFSDYDIQILPQFFNFSKIYTQIFLISFNPYFSNPMFNYYLRESIITKGTMLYTLMFADLNINVKYRNIFPTVNTLMSLFSGRHSWSSHLSNSSSVVIMDSLFFRSLPSILKIVISTFMKLNPKNIYLINLPKEYSFGLSRVSYTQVPRSSGYYPSMIHSIFTDFNSSQGSNSIVQIKNAKVPFFLTGSDYSDIFSLAFIQFSYSNVLADNTLKSFLQYWFPKSDFTNFSTKYKFIGNSNTYVLNRVLSVLSQRPFGSIFKMIGNRFLDSQQYSHLNFSNIGDFFCLFQFFLPVTNFNLSIIDSFLFFQIQYSIGSYLSSVDYYPKVNFNFVNMIKIPEIGLLPVNVFRKFTYFYPKYVGLVLINSSDSVKGTFSKTLVLEREFTMRRFINFFLKEKINFKYVTLCGFHTMDVGIYI